MDQYITQCPNCCAQTVLNRVGVTPAGAPIYRCASCERNAVLHSHPGISFWLPVLETGISSACPACGVVEQVAEIVAQAPDVPRAIREIAQGVFAVALAAGTIIFAGAVLKSLREAT